MSCTSVQAFFFSSDLLYPSPNSILWVAGRLVLQCPGSGITFLSALGLLNPSSVFRKASDTDHHTSCVLSLVTEGYPPPFWFLVLIDCFCYYSPFVFCIFHIYIFFTVQHFELTLSASQIKCIIIISTISSHLNQSIQYLHQQTYFKREGSVCCRKV